MNADNNVKQDLWHFEKKAKQNGFKKIAGIDEAGRGPLAGPVVSAAVILPFDFNDIEIFDSKQLSSKKRSFLYDKIYKISISIGIGIIDPIEIDRINILQASLLSMSIAASNLSPEPDFLLIDGTFKIPLNINQKPIAHGDTLSISIASASIIAKVTRDRLMDIYHEEYPEFGFISHKGYPTKFHKEVIANHGISPIHRRTFKGVKEYL